MVSVPVSLTLPSLIGVSVNDTGCILNPEQIARLGSLLLQSRPQDPQAVCFVGGALSTLVAGNRKSSVPPIVSLQNDFGDDPFLVIAGRQGALVLLASESQNGYRTRILSNSDIVDRAALVLAQFSDQAYSLDAVCDPEMQRAFISSVVAALLADPVLGNTDLAALLPEDQRWVALALTLHNHPDRATKLTLPAIQKILQESSIARILLGQLDADQQQLAVLAAEGGPTPRIIRIGQGTLTNVIRSRRTGSSNSPETSGMQGEGMEWLRGYTFTAAPLLRDDRVWGMLVAASERPLTNTARATLNGLGTLLIALPGPASALPSRSAPPPTATPPAPANRAAPSAVGSDLRSRQMNRALAAPRNGPTATAQDLAALIEHLHDAVLLVDGQGRIVAFTSSAMHLLEISREAIGKSLVESGAWCLAPLLTDALVGDLQEMYTVEMPNGQQARATIIGMNQSIWAFVLDIDQTAPIVSAYNAAPAVSDHERNENFLANFSNIIRVPLRELRNLITSVPAAGELNEQQSRLIGQVVKLNSELTMLVNDLLALGQIRLQTNENRIPLRLDLLVEAAVGTQYAEFGRRGQQVTTDIPANLPRVPGSEEGLGRAVAALLDNAIKYSPTGAQIKLVLSNANKHVTVSIQDTGVGLNSEELEQVFDPFYRAQSAEQLGVSGRGLGLTIAKAVIEQHDGRIWAASSPGKGSTFSFSLPCES